MCLVYGSLLEMVFERRLFNDRSIISRSVITIGCVVIRVFVSVLPRFILILCVLELLIFKFSHFN